MDKKKIKDIIARASKTFIQAFLGSLTIDSFFGVTDVDAIKRIGLSMLVGAVAAGVSAVWNTLLDILYRWIDKKFPVFVPEEDAPIEFDTPMESEETILIDAEEEENVESF
jgi:hypothetical protein